MLEPDDVSQQRADKEKNALVRAIYRDLVGSVQALGYELQGFSCKLAEGDCLLTLRASSHDADFVTFVGAADMPAAFVKAVREARGDALRWREDRYGRK